jgi:hypothetical protein
MTKREKVAIVAPVKRAKEAAKQDAVTVNVPLNFLLGCSETAICNYYLQRLADIADTEKELIILIHRLTELKAQRDLAHFFRTIDREGLKHALESEESMMEWAKRMLRERGKGEEDLAPLPTLEAG